MPSRGQGHASPSLRAPTAARPCARTHMSTHSPACLAQPERTHRRRCNLQPLVPFRGFLNLRTMAHACSACHTCVDRPQRPVEASQLTAGRDTAHAPLAPKRPHKRIQAICLELWMPCRSC
eukprot:356907-Chlamydomonas_euryale.AAC.9